MATSLNNTVIAAGISGASITDSKGQVWSITPTGQVALNGQPDTSTSGVAKLAWVSNVIWQENGNGLWWGSPSLTPGQWSPGSGTTSPLPANAPIVVAPVPTPVPIPVSTTAQTATIQAQIVAVAATLAGEVATLTQLSNSISGGTRSGVPLPAGWGAVQSDVFGTGPGCTVSTMAELHAHYYEGMYYNRTANGLVSIPNVVVNHEQQTYGHFEDVIVFSADHLTIQARGHPDGSISSGEMVSKWTGRSFAIEFKYRIPNVMCAWPGAWVYACAAGADQSELDFEQPITQYNTVHTVTMENHPNDTTAQTTIADGRFSTQYMTWTDPNFDASAAPHSYTVLYDDTGPGTVSRFIDGKLIYSITPWKWNFSLGGTGHGPDASALFNLAGGGDWPGAIANPSAFSADLDLFSLDIYAPIVST